MQCNGKSGSYMYSTPNIQTYDRFTERIQVYLNGHLYTPLYRYTYLYMKEITRLSRCSGNAPHPHKFVQNVLFIHTHGDDDCTRTVATTTQKLGSISRSYIHIPTHTHTHGIF